MSDLEKHASSHDEREDRAIDLDIPDPDAHLSPEERDQIERRLVWRLDLILIPWLCLLYLLAFLDRTNIGNAKIAGLVPDLGLTTSQYNIALTIFFISYSVFEPLTNVLLKKLRPSIFIPIIMFLWGASMTGQGFVYNNSGLLASRWFLGLTEAGLFPGVNYYLSCWYKRSEFGIRAAIFFSAAALSGSFGGLLAAAIEKLDGKGGLEGWRWIFILEGLLTVVVAVISFWMVHDFPDDARFLSEEDRARVIRRLRLDQQASSKHEDWNTRYLYDGLKDWKMWLGMAIYMGCDMPLYAFSLFLPSIIMESGWSNNSIHTNLLSVPPYAAAAVLTVIVGFIADRTRQRGLCNILSSLIGIVGFILLIASDSPAVKYAATFLGALGIYPCISNTITWMANNTEGVYKRGVVLGFVIGWGNLNGIVSSNIYFDPPRYLQGHGVVLAYMIIFLFGGSILMTTLLRVENKKRLEGKRDYLAEGKSEAELDLLGDRRPDFLYTV
ncbi:major facilitator superfamily domain-containing protein [Xylaria bambusicola]|uniref:major facilitator superfamily domain-containing protein n=1 Tax=Xylaria bambusicola TaxID=326684 RepID=UPI0020073801|nr:major facilitator superfamily domain-containing protein [Xylaria bambusicola]KAI0515274.1 major facilitator superfamily domain-containing protein [Xylaria bambusicola]